MTSFWTLSICKYVSVYERCLWPNKFWISRPVCDNKANKVVNTLGKSGVDVTRTDFSGLFSKDRNTNMYKVSENDNIS